MKMKFMMAAVLASALTLGACVEDKESQSVTDVRNAKTEQLKSVAAMNNATAEATRMLAEADAALKAAQAEAVKAETALKVTENELARVNVELAKVKLELAGVEVDSAKAELELKKTELELKKTELEGNKAQLEVEKARAKAELETIAANLETSLLRAKTELLDAQMSYNASLEQMEDIEKARLSNLLGEYTRAADALLGAQQTLADSKMLLARQEAGLIDLREAKEEAVAANDKEIERLRKEIGYKRAEVEVYGKYQSVSRDEALEAWQKAQNEQLDADKSMTKAFKDYGKTQEAVREVMDKLNNCAYEGKYTYFLGSYFDVPLERCADYENGRPADTYGDYGFYRYDEKTGERSFVSMFPADVQETQQLKRPHEEGMTQEFVTWDEYVRYHAFDEAGFTAWFAAMEEYVADHEGRSFDDAKKAYADAVKAEQAAQKEYADAVKAEAAAKAEAEKENATAEDIRKYEEARVTTQNKEALLHKARTESDNALTGKNVAEDRKTEALNEIKSIRENYDVLAAEADFFAKVVAELNAAMKTRAEAYVEYEKAEILRNLKSAEARALYTIYEEAGNIESLIESLNAQIDRYEEQIGQIEADNADTASIVSQEQLIERQKQVVANNEAAVEVAKVEADRAKAAFDAAMN